jgi:hypothetical protein
MFADAALGQVVKVAFDSERWWLRLYLLGLDELLFGLVFALEKSGTFFVVAVFGFAFTVRGRRLVFV